MASDGYKKTSPCKAWGGAGKSNVKESRLNKGGDTKFGTAMKAKMPKAARKY